MKKKTKKNDNSSTNLTVNKITNIFDYYLKLVFKFVKKDIENYQEKKEIQEKKMYLMNYLIIIKI